MANKNLNKAKVKKNDEFYTLYADIEKEVEFYHDQLKGKVIYCNCDDPVYSKFWEYFHRNFTKLGLKKLITTYYNENGNVCKMEYTGGIDDVIQIGRRSLLKGNGDFRSKECVEILDDCDIVVSNPPFSCYSSDTEVMTNHGWKLIKDVNIKEDIIMSLNPENKQIEMVKAINFISSPVNGELYHFHNRNMDFCVTGNHKMYAYYRNMHNYQKPIPLINAEDVKKSYLLPLNGFYWKGRQQKYFYLPEVMQLQQYSRKEIVVPEKQILMKDWLEFFGFWLADGCWRDHINTYGKRDYTICIKQNEKNEQYVLDLISRIGFKANISKGKNRNNNYSIYSKQLWSYLSQFGRSTDKYIPREFLELDVELLKCLFQGYLNGDGSKCADGHYHLSSVSKTLMENIQELILKIYGMTTQIRKSERKYSYNDKVGISYNINVLFERNIKFSNYGVADKIPYHDNVYCLTLEKNHIMFVRHNGIVGWCGNCFCDYLTSLIEHEKKFLIVGNKNAAIYKDIFPYIKIGEVKFGYNNIKEFMQPDGIIKKFGNVGWFTNLEKEHCIRKLMLTHHYYDAGHVTQKDDVFYPSYENFDAIDVNRINRIPIDYEGIMGVPMTFLEYYDPKEFELIGYGKENEKNQMGIGHIPNEFLQDFFDQGGRGHYTIAMRVLCFYDQNGKAKFPFTRLLIRRK